MGTPPLYFLQILQTVVPIIPGALTSVAGVFIYGHIVGTIYNYIGIVIGLRHHLLPSSNLMAQPLFNLLSANELTINTSAGLMRQSF